MSDTLPDNQVPAAVHSRITQAILDAVGHIPHTDETKSRNPREQARRIASTAATRAALAAGGLATFPGPTGLLTLVPELLAVWRVQTQMISDIAAIFGQKSTLTKEQMLYCLFKATAAKAVGELVVIIGQRVLVRRATLRVLESVARRVGIKVTQKLLGKGIARWLPIVGALGVGAYTYYETGKVAQAAIDLFDKAIEVESTVAPVTPPARPKRPRKTAAANKETRNVAKPTKPKRRRRKPGSTPGA